MKIGVLNCGPVAEELAPRYGQYDRVFADWLGARDPSLSFTGWDAHLGALPADPDEADAWILSGSKYGVYEDHDWIAPLSDFIRAAAVQRKPMIGVCFGHQIMAEALGGRAEKWSGGWNLGRRVYETGSLPAWMADAPARPALHAVHQDQVTAPPPDARTVMTGDGCAHAALVYGDPEKPYAITIQPHPEFSDPFMKDLVELRRGAAFPVDQSDAALAALGAPTSRDWAADWFLAFLKG